MGKEIGGEPNTKHLQGITINGRKFYWAYDPVGIKIIISSKKANNLRHLWYFDGKKPYTLCGKNAEFPELIIREEYPKDFRCVCRNCYNRAISSYCKQRKIGRISSNTNKPLAMTWRKKKLRHTKREY